MFRQLFRNIAKFAWVLPGLLLWAAFPPVGEKTDVLFALAPLMWLSRRSSPWRSAKRWFLSGMVFWVATLSWMPAIVKNGGPWPLVVLGWVLLSAYCSLFFGAYGYISAGIWGWARNGSYLRRLFAILLFEPVLWCGLELVRSRFLGGFAWNQLGVVAANGGFGMPASIGGVYLLSATIILINGTFAGIAERFWKPEQSGFANLRRLGTVETVLAFGLIWGIYCLDGSADLPPTESSQRAMLKVGLVQRNFPCVFKSREENPYLAYSNLVENISNLKPDLVVLAESAMCEFGPVDQQGAVCFADWLSNQCGGAQLLSGGTRYAEGNTYNSAALYGNGEIQFYDKVHLVPFGEFIPGDKLFPALQRLAPVGSCTPGDVRLLSVKAKGEDGKPFSVQTGCAICFEDTDSALAREFASRGARLLCFITNDSWFSHSIEPVQHSWHATVRAIETGLPVVRVGNGGVTGTITPQGRATWLIGTNGRSLLDRRGTMFDRMEITVQAGKSPTTAYVRWGDWPLGIIFSLLMMGVLLVKSRSSYAKRRYVSM